MNIDTETGEILEESTAENAISWLAEYTQAVRDMESFKAKHSQTIEKYFSLQREIAATEEELKKAARESGPVENESFTVSVVTPYSKWYDAEIILKEFPQVKALPGVVVETVDKKKIEALAKNGMIPKDIVDRAYCEEPGTPRVRIVVKDQFSRETSL